MKNSILMAGIILFAASCSSESDVTVSKTEDGRATVNVHVNSFTSEQEEFASTRGMTRATDVNDVTSVKFITLAFYSGGEEVYKQTQFRTDASTYETFGVFSTSLSVGSYTMVVIGYGGTTEITLTSPTSAAYPSKALDTFVHTETVNVNTTSNLDLSATLNRIVTRLKLQTTDNMPTNVAKVRVDIGAGGIGFNPTTGFATVNNGFTNEIVPSSGYGSTTSFSSYLFLATDEQTMNVSITVLDASDNVLFSKNVTNVPMKRNRTTTLRGKLFGADATTAFSVEADWLEENFVDF